MSEPERRFFTRELEPIYRAIARRILPPDDEAPGGDADAAVTLVDHNLSQRSAQQQKLLATFLRTVEKLPKLRYGRRFTELEPQQQTAVLEFLERNPVAKLRQGFFGVKTFVLMGYYTHPDTWSEIGYPGPRSDAPYYQLSAKRGNG